MFPKNHPYYPFIIGSHADIESAQLADVRGFFRDYYVPNNATMVIVGDFDKARAKALVAKYFGPIPAGKPVVKPTVVTPPITAERRKVVTDKVELPRVSMAWLTPAAYKPGDAEADLLGIILGGGKASRLYRKLVYEQQIAQDVSVAQASMMLQSVFQIEVTARPGVKPEQIEQAVDAELALLRDKGPTEAEVEQARNRMLSAIIQGLETTDGVADQLNRYNQYPGHAGLPAAGRGALYAADAGSCCARLRIACCRRMRARCSTACPARRSSTTCRAARRLPIHQCHRRRPGTGAPRSRPRGRCVPCSCRCPSSSRWPTASP